METSIQVQLSRDYNASRDVNILKHIESLEQIIQSILGKSTSKALQAHKFVEILNGLCLPGQRLNFDF